MAEYDPELLELINRLVRLTGREDLHDQFESIIDEAYNKGYDDAIMEE